MDDLRSSCQVVSEELKKREYFYNAFVASVSSVLKDGITWSPDDLLDKKQKKL